MRYGLMAATLLAGTAWQAQGAVPQAGGTMYCDGQVEMVVRSVPGQVRPGLRVTVYNRSRQTMTLTVTPPAMPEITPSTFAATMQPGNRAEGSLGTFLGRPDQFLSIAGRLLVNCRYRPVSRPG